MTEDKISTLLSDVSVEGDIVEKDKIIIDAKVNGDIKSEDIETFSSSNIKGNIKSKIANSNKNRIKFIVTFLIIIAILMPVQTGYLRLIT